MEGRLKPERPAHVPGKLRLVPSIQPQMVKAAAFRLLEGLFQFLFRLLIGFPVILPAHQEKGTAASQVGGCSVQDSARMASTTLIAVTAA